MVGSKGWEGEGSKEMSLPICEIGDERRVRKTSKFGC
jgi:hypothetical protein